MEYSKRELELFRANGFDSEQILEIEYRKAILFIKNMLFRSEKTLIEEQAKDEVNESRLKSIEQTYNRLLFIYGKYCKMDTQINELKVENQMFRDKLEFYKIKI
jgi:hypothetical protein